MKASFAFAAAAAVAVNAAATPARIEARASEASSGSLPAVTVKGNAFFAGNERFYIRGIDYQPGGSSDAADGSDPLADVQACTRDIAKFKELGVNTVRVYTVDNSKSHDQCMSMLADAGIYLALDVNSPNYSLNREEPAGSYNDVYLQSVFATIDAFHKYSNTLLFFSGNEVINADNNTNCAPYIKATTRDMKSYINSMGYRKIPVGYSAADVESNRYDLATYMNCGTEDQRSDFFAFNDYSWCDPDSSFTISGWDAKVKQYGDYSIPLFLSEYGCIENKRNFEEVSTLYSSQMTSVYSGGLVYEYSEEGSGYGLVTISGNSVKPKSDFNFLKQQFAKTQSGGDGGYKSSGSPSECPKRSSTWEVKDFLGPALPSMPEGAKKYIGKGAGKAPGLHGDGSQWATDGQSQGTAVPGSGAVASGSSSSASGAASSATAEGAASSVFRGDATLMPFLACGATVFFSMFFGAAML
ncbi:1,3-beta-glucanosyltransferase [Saxophila tyrrhenica]|uniref:1,3-beta-glucanosyltransferase n=1 Tax=Saxophila tyrrhenica TaxID=1690608 RepID=A0AAV9PEW5_9PEZI|nr:1,3-beta-glucanosyltransferase [Saxophila tyrrhenica]